MILYDEAEQDYHSNLAIGSGDVRAFIRSPQLFMDQRDGIYPRESRALLFGAASHLSLLEPARYARTVAIKPDGMSFATKEGKAWRAEHAGRVIVSAKDAEALELMHRRMPPCVREILSGDGRAEVSVRRDVDGMACQARVDWWKGSTLYDLKTISKIELIDRAIAARRYDVQQEWYRMVVRAETGHDLQFQFLFVETAPPYRWRIVELDQEWMEAGRRAMDDAVMGIKTRCESGCWTDDGSIYITATPPPWLAPGLTETEEGIDL